MMRSCQVLSLSSLILALLLAGGCTRQNEPETSVETEQATAQLSQLLNLPADRLQYHGVTHDPLPDARNWSITGDAKSRSRAGRVATQRARLASYYVYAGTDLFEKCPFYSPPQPFTRAAAIEASMALSKHFWYQGTESVHVSKVEVEARTVYAGVEQRPIPMLEVKLTFQDQAPSQPRLAVMQYRADTGVCFNIFTPLSW